MIDRTDVIRSERLDLQPLTVADADEMSAVLDDPRLYTFIGGEPLPLDDLRDRFRRLSAGQSDDGREERHNWIVRTRVDGQAIGTVQATIGDAGRQAAIAWVIGVPWASAAVAARAGLEPTPELLHGERVWRRQQPNRNADLPTSTDESR